MKWTFCRWHRWRCRRGRHDWRGPIEMQTCRYCGIREVDWFLAELDRMGWHPSPASWTGAAR